VRSRGNTYPVFGYLLAVSGLLLLAGCTGEQDQAVDDLAIAYVKRSIPIVPASNPPQMIEPDVRIPASFNSGGNVFVRESASPSASELNITSCLTLATDADDVDGDVKDLDTSYDGTKLIFSLFAPHDPGDDTDTTTWDIYEYDLAAGGCPTRVITSDVEAEKGDDLGPTYLPDGRIVFTSNRQDLVKAIQTDEAGGGLFPPQDESLGEDTLVLHVMDSSGNNIKQISFNQSHDLDPSVLSSGEIVFSRWDNMGSSDAINLYKIRPDGTELKALYGVHAHDVGTGGSTVQFLSPRERDDGRILGMIKPFTGSRGGGAPVLINVAQYADNNQPIWPFQSAGLTGNGQVNAVALSVTTDASISPAGRFRSVYPLRDGSNRALVSWTQCRLEEADGDIVPCPDTIPANATEAFPLYGIYIYDLSSNTQLPVVIPEEDFIYDEPVVAAARPTPTILFDKAPVPGFGLDPTLAIERVGLLHIRSVYDFDGNFNDLGANPPVDNLAAMSNPDDVDPLLGTNADRRPARFLRVVKGVYIPEEVDPNIDGDSDPLDNSAFGVSTQQGMREILGYAPIEPDGSVLVKVPANTPFAFSVVDKDGRRVMDNNGRLRGARHQNWLQVQSGEVLECNGCHDHNPMAPALPSPHGYSDDSTPVLNAGAGTTGAPFPGTDPAVLANMGETMALTRIRLACGENAAGALGLNVSIGTCSALSPKLDMSFTDVWTDPAGTPTPGLDILYSGLTTPAPTINRSIGCSSDTWSPWDPICRTIINYEDHIHPLWVESRAGGTSNCTDAACHNSLNNTRVPEAHLDLSDGQSALNGNTEHYKSYSELLVQDLQRNADGTPVEQIIGFQDRLDPITGDPVLDPVTGLVIQDPIIITFDAPGPSMSINGARASYFIDKFLAGSGDPIHEALLSPAELRLISEWLDMGAQYFNTPFHPDVPVD